jgi:toxin ParE1/3/4
VNRVRFVEPARLEFLAEVGYYQRFEEGLGAKFLEAVEDATARVLAYPLAGSPARHRPRRAFLKGFPFSLIYRSDEQGITPSSEALVSSNRPLS